ncbi:hypothetical protein TNCT_289151 [Trichonephila clavata]|uniref:Uncharacterized protein n=1 Tax=Trichonephila clavata TaxID=2740835 RepID=A0A8X6JDY4_TRICU|nr:hypothetical protein TNCT_289151 [Trichonephila clavata]
MAKNWFLTVVDQHWKRKDDLKYDELETTVIFMLRVHSLLPHRMRGVHMPIPQTCTMPQHSRKVSDYVIKMILEAMMLGCFQRTMFAMIAFLLYQLRVKC